MSLPLDIAIGIAICIGFGYLAGRLETIIKRTAKAKHHPVPTLARRVK